MRLTNNYLLDHALIAIMIQIFFLATVSLFLPLDLKIMLWSIVPGSLFYSLRELWQYYVQDKRHNGGFDWFGMFSPLLANLTVFAVWTLIYLLLQIEQLMTL